MKAISERSTFVLKMSLLSIQEKRYKSLDSKLFGLLFSHRYTGGYTMDVIASTAFGIRVDSQKDRNNTFVTNAKEAFDFDLKNPVTIIRSKLLYSLDIKGECNSSGSTGLQHTLVV